MITHIVIPIGVGAPGTPVQSYLEQSIESIKRQTCDKYILTVAADTNIPDECKNYLHLNEINVKWFEPFTYFRKGGIWKKIFDTWKSIDSEYVAFLHYDDLWDSNKLEIQLNDIISKKLEGNWSETYIINDCNDIVSSDCSLNELTIDTVGMRSVAFAHSCIISKNSILNSGILDFEDEWSANFEDVWALYVHKIKNVEKSIGAKMYWRNHSMNISSTVREDAEFVKQQRASTNYSLYETLKDSENIKIQLQIEKIKLMYK